MVFPGPPTDWGARPAVVPSVPRSLAAAGSDAARRKRARPAPAARRSGKSPL
jgi:hypothetical protein